MINWLLIFLWVFTFGKNRETDRSPSVQGKWKIVFTYHTTNGKRSEGSPPLMDAYWTFRPDGTYLIEAGVRETGKYTATEKSIVMDSDKPLMPDMDIRTYAIVKLDDTHLTLSIAIMESAEFTMLNFVDFTREP